MRNRPATRMRATRSGGMVPSRSLSWARVDNSAAKARAVPSMDAAGSTLDRVTVV
jgi:hypothetical protein